jgi:CRISPR-associated protein Cst2
VAGYDSYGFHIDEGQHRLPEIVDGILAGDYPGEEFFLGGQLVKEMDEATSKELTKHGVTLERNPQRLLMTVADRAGLTAAKG